MNGLYSGFTALRASQTAMDVIAENLANANTPGYHRRDVQLSERTIPSSPDRGYGVRVDQIRRIRSGVTEGLLTANISAQADSDVRIRTLEDLETLVTPRDGSIHDRLQLFFRSVQELGSRSDDSALKRLVVERGAQLASDIRALGVEADRIQASLDQEIRTTVRDVNDIADELKTVHNQLLLETPDTTAANALRDQYDKIVNQLGELVDVRPDKLNVNHNVVRFASDAALVGQVYQPLEFTYQNDQAIVQRVGTDEPLNFQGGKLGGLLAARNDILSSFRDELEQLTTELVTAVDSIHASAIGTAGSFDVLTGVRSVSDVDAPLSDAGLALPVTDGSLFVYITDDTTGEGRLEKIDIDPDTDSLRSVAAKLSGISGLQTLISEETGTLTIAADPGLSFDFTGRPQTRPDASGITGTSQLTLSGIYSGSRNQTLVLDVPADGTIGITEGFVVDLRDQDGNLVRRLELGADYEPGTEIEVTDGVRIAFSSGTLLSGDTTSADLVAQSDTSGILVALGLNTFFSGTDTRDLQVNSDILADNSRLATTLTGDASDTTALTRLLQMRDAKVARGGNSTLEESIADLTSKVGNDLASSRLVMEGLELSGQQLEAQRDSVSGVDPNEELVRMLTYQRAFQAASRVISTVDQVYQELLSII